MRRGSGIVHRIHQIHPVDPIEVGGVPRGKGKPLAKSGCGNDAVTEGHAADLAKPNRLFDHLLIYREGDEVLKHSVESRFVFPGQTGIAVNLDPTGGRDRDPMLVNKFRESPEFAPRSIDNDIAVQKHGLLPAWQWAITPNISLPLGGVGAISKISARGDLFEASHCLLGIWFSDWFHKQRNFHFASRNVSRYVQIEMELVILGNDHLFPYRRHKNLLGYILFRKTTTATLRNQGNTEATHA